MKKFLSPEETLNLLKLGIPSRYITYYACEDGRFDAIANEYVTYFGIRHKSEITTIFSKYKPVFSVADLIMYLKNEFDINIDTVLIDQKWNFYSYEYEDESELIDYLHDYIIRYLEKHPQTPDYVEPPKETCAISTSATLNLDNTIYYSINDEN